MTSLKNLHEKYHKIKNDKDMNMRYFRSMEIKSK